MPSSGRMFVPQPKIKQAELSVAFPNSEIYLYCISRSKVGDFIITLEVYKL